MSEIGIQLFTTVWEAASLHQNVEVNVFTPDIVIGITFYGFEAGRKLVRSRSNYFAHDGQRAFRSSTKTR